MSTEAGPKEKKEEIVDRNFFSAAFKLSTNYIPFTGNIMPRSIIILYACDNMDIKYNAVTYLYFSAQPSSFKFILLRSETVVSFLTVQFFVWCVQICWQHPNCCI